MNKTHFHQYRLLIQGTVLSLAVFGSAAQADDVEVYVTTPVTISPNILFVLDESGSMCTCADQPGEQACVTRSDVCWDWNNPSLNDQNPGQRMYQLKQAMRNLINDESMDNVRTAILGYRGNITLAPHSPFVRIGEGANRSNLLNNVIGDAHLGGNNNGTLVHSGSTPSSPALRMSMDWYRNLLPNQQSPINNWCEPNYIVFLTDGSPNTNGLTSYAGIDCFTNETVNNNWEDMQGDVNDTSGGRCSATIAEWGYNHRPLNGDAWNYGDNDPGLKRFRNLITHTIGFHTTANSNREQYLIDIASRSPDENPDHVNYDFGNDYGADLGTFDENDPYTGGRYVRANNSASLLAALQSFVDQANREVTYSYTAPTIPFNADNAAVSGDEMYLPVFKPGATTFWKGNIKKFQVKYDQANGQLRVLDKDGKPAINNLLRFVSATDYWNDTGSTDGAEPLVGGANSNMNPMISPRKLYTYLHGNEYDLTLPENQVHAENDKITKELMEVRKEPWRNNQLNWANWLKKDGVTPRTGDDAPQMGAPLHTRPVTVRYKNANDLVLISTTEGILHAFDGSNGQEAWAFMPDELLKTIKTAKNEKADELPMYGLDGPMTVYRVGAIYQDEDQDGFPDLNGDGEEILLAPGQTFVIVGMRRGFSKGAESGHVNRNYYVLDISDPEEPKFAWEIIGGIPGTNFADLGQTWSKPIFTKLEIEGTDAQDVLIFGGGYNPDQDSATEQVDDDIGNAIYIVNPKDGTLIRKIVSDDMEKGTMGNAIVADVLPVDINANGITDRLYASDVGGRIIRVDIPDKALGQITNSNELRGAIIANIGDKDGFQRFFETPTMAYYKRGAQQYLALLIGSGKRPNPTDDSVTDRFYMFKDYNVWAAPLTYQDVATEEQLADVTNNDAQQGDAEDKADALNEIAQRPGWYLDLDAGVGEKVFSEARVYDYAVFFTTYSATKEEPDVCTATSVDGESFLYALDMRHGGARFNSAGKKFEHGDANDLDKNDRKISLDIPGMPPSPAFMFPAKDNSDGPGGSVLALAGMQVAIDMPRKFIPISWEEVIDD